MPVVYIFSLLLFSLSLMPMAFNHGDPCPDDLDFTSLDSFLGRTYLQQEGILPFEQNSSTSLLVSPGDRRHVFDTIRRVNDKLLMNFGEAQRAHPLDENSDQQLVGLVLQFQYSLLEQIERGVPVWNNFKDFEKRLASFVLREDYLSPWPTVLPTVHKINQELLELCVGILKTNNHIDAQELLAAITVLRFQYRYTIIAARSTLKSYSADPWANITVKEGIPYFGDERDFCERYGRPSQRLDAPLRSLSLEPTVQAKRKVQAEKPIPLTENAASHDVTRCGPMLELLLEAEFSRAPYPFHEQEIQKCLDAVIRHGRKSAGPASSFFMVFHVKDIPYFKVSDVGRYKKFLSALPTVMRALAREEAWTTNHTRWLEILIRFLRHTIANYDARVRHHLAPANISGAATIEWADNALNKCHALLEQVLSTDADGSVQFETQDLNNCISAMRLGLFKYKLLPNTILRNPPSEVIPPFDSDNKAVVIEYKNHVRPVIQFIKNLFTRRPDEMLSLNDHEQYTWSSVFLRFFISLKENSIILGNSSQDLETQSRRPLTPAVMTPGLTAQAPDTARGNEPVSSESEISNEDNRPTKRRRIETFPLHNMPDSSAPHHTGGESEEEVLEEGSAQNMVAPAVEGIHLDLIDDVRLLMGLKRRDS